MDALLCTSDSALDACSDACSSTQRRQSGTPQPATLRAVRAHAACSLQVFFLVLALALLGVRARGDRRAQLLMSGSPAVKLGLWLLFNALPFFLPNSAVFAYGYLARTGSALFLVIQLFLLLDFVLTMNEKWVAAAEEDERHYKGMLGVTVGCYAACLVLVGAHPPAQLSPSYL